MQRDGIPRHGIPFGWHIPSQRMVKAKEVAKGRACECVCAACGVRLIAKQGLVRVWHFAHDEEANCHHAAEAAIHRMAKQLIAERGSIVVPPRQLSRTIHGKKRVWTETITVEVQAAGLQTLADCQPEKTLRNPMVEDEYRRLDVFASLDGRPLAIEVLNTHAVDLDKQDWLEQLGYSILELDVGDLALLPPDLIQETLETRLFLTSDHSIWLAHAKDGEAQVTLDHMEAEVRRHRQAEELGSLARLEAAEAAQKRKEEFLKRVRDIEDFKVRIEHCTVRVGRNQQRVSLKVFGIAPDAIFEGIRSIARKHQGWFNNRGRCWEFYRHSETEAFFKQVCLEIRADCLERFRGGAPSPSTPTVKLHPSPESRAEEHRPIYFSDPALQELFDERAAILEFEGGLDRSTAERKALGEVSSRASGQTSSDP